MVVETVNGTELRFKNPGRLLLVVFAFIFWGVGFLDLLGHTSADPEIFGLYSLPLFILILLYGSTIVIWFALFFNSNLLSRVADGVGYIQNNTVLAIVSFIGIGFAFWVIFEWDRWSRLPGLQFTAFGLLLLAFLILLFSNWSEAKGRQTWRRLIAYPLAALVVLELVIQAVTWLGGLPRGVSIGGNFYPYERIYYNGDGLRNDFANRYGWFFPDAELDDEKRRILILGGSYVQALPVPPEYQVNFILSGMLNQDLENQTGQVEIVPIGMPGFGVSPFLYEDTMLELPDLLNTREMIVFFHLGDDFQSPSASHNAIRYIAEEGNGFKVDPGDARLRHDLTHYFLRGFLSLQPVETVRSNYLTPKVIAGLVQNSRLSAQAAGESAGGGTFNFPRLVGSVTDTYDLTEPGHAGIKTTDLQIIPGGNNFMFVRGGSEATKEAVAIADSMLKIAQEIAQANNITLRLVTVPAFPEEFNGSFNGEGWEPEIGEYDLFLPEKALIETARRYDISILPMGQYMLEDGLTVKEINVLFMSGEQGSLTPAGHEYYAKAIYSCFYEDGQNDFCSIQSAETE